MPNLEEDKMEKEVAEDTEDSMEIAQEVTEAIQTADIEQLDKIQEAINTRRKELNSDKMKKTKPSEMFDTEGVEI